MKRADWSSTLSNPRMSFEHSLIYFLELGPQFLDAAEFQKWMWWLTFDLIL